MDTKFTTIQVSQEMRKQLRAIAQQQGRKMYALVDELLGFPNKIMADVMVSLAQDATDGR